ncbi:unnamed protein product [Closterium sp. NIES-65]|nr:unnamed protein product [Closterium sp. NIES-65]
MGEERGQQEQQQEGQQQEGQQGRQQEGQRGQATRGEERGQQRQQQQQQQQQQHGQQWQEGQVSGGEERGQHSQQQEVQQGQERLVSGEEERGQQGQQRDGQQGQVGLRVQGATQPLGASWFGERGREEVAGNMTAGAQGLGGKGMEGGDRARVLGGLGLGRGDGRRQVGGGEDREAETTKEEAQRDQAQQQPVQQQRQARRTGRIGAPARIPDLTCRDIEKTLMVLVDVPIADPQQQGNTGLRRVAPVQIGVAAARRVQDKLRDWAPHLEGLQPPPHFYACVVETFGLLSEPMRQCFLLLVSSSLLFLFPPFLRPFSSSQALLSLSPFLCSTISTVL